MAMLDWTMREIDNFARGADAARRAAMATMLWAHHSGAGFAAYAYAGKRIPNIDQRLRRIMEQPGRTGRRRNEVASVIERMNAIARQAGMPPPRPRARKPKD